jgi:hypothetical protein
LKKISGRSCIVHSVIGRRAEVRLFHARGLASQVRHSSRPHFLALDRRAKHDVRDAVAGSPLRSSPFNRPHRIGALQEPATTWQFLRR